MRDSAPQIFRFLQLIIIAETLSFVYGIGAKNKGIPAFSMIFVTQWL